MKFVRPSILAVLLLGTLRNFADTVELNGLTCLFGDNLACFILYQPAAAKPQTFMLSEGESKFGIKLVAVDGAHRRALIEQCGVKKYVRIGGVPDLSPAENATLELVATAAEIAGGALTPAEQKILDGFLVGNPEVDRIRAGKPIYNFSATKKSASESDNGSSTSPRSGTTPASTPIPSTATGSPAVAAGEPVKDPTKEVWYVESLIIEQDRITSAEDVMARRATPLPRTPFTPANTPARLIGKETFFSNHIPGYIVPGYMQPLASMN